MENLATRAKTKLNLSREQLAAKIGVHPITVYRWERGGSISGPVKRLLEDLISEKPVTQ